MTEVTMEGKNWKWCHPATSRSTYPQVVVVNSLSLQYALSHGANSMSPCLPHLPLVSHHLQREDEFTIRVSGVPFSMQVKPGPQPHLICITCNAMTGLWSGGCAVSSQRSQLARSPGDDETRRSGEDIPHLSTQMAMPCWTSKWLVKKKKQELNPGGGCAMVAQRTSGQGLDMN